MANGIRTGNPRGLNKGRSLKFRVGSRVRQRPEEGWRTYWPKRCGNNNKDEGNSPKTLNVKNFVTDFNIAMVLIVLTFTLNSSSPSLFFMFLSPVPRTSTTISITITFMFHKVFNSLAKSTSLSRFSLPFIFSPLSAGANKNSLCDKFLLNYPWFCLLNWIE